MLLIVSHNTSNYYLHQLYLWTELKLKRVFHNKEYIGDIEQWTDEKPLELNMFHYHKMISNLDIPISLIGENLQ